MSPERGRYSFLPNPEPALALNAGGGRNGGGGRRLVPSTSKKIWNNVIRIESYRTKQ